MGYRVKLPPFRAEGENAIDVSPIPEKVVIPVITGDLSTEPPASPPVTRQERWAELDAEEALFRVCHGCLDSDGLRLTASWGSSSRFHHH